jgi:hypothetical protein
MDDKEKHYDNEISYWGIERRNELDKCSKVLFDLIVKDK